MSTDVKLLLLPESHFNGTNDWFANSAIALKRSESLDVLIEKLGLPIEPVPRNITIAWENEDLSADRFGNRLTYCLAGDFRSVVLPEIADPWNLATFTYIQSLPEKTAVIFLWS